MTFFRYLIILISSIYLVSCDLEKTAQQYENLPRANGIPGEIFVVMDSAQWVGPVGMEIRGIFSASVPTIPREEPQFKLNYFSPKNFQGFLKKQKNIMFVTVLGDKSNGNRRLKSYFTNESLKMIEDDPSLFMYSKQDEFARGQEVLHLFGETADVLVDNLSRNRQKLLDHFKKIEEDRIYQGFYSVKYEKGISNHIQKKLGCELKVPLGFEIGLEDDKFIWLRSFSPDIDKSIFISYVDYTSEEMFSLDSLLKLRTEISKPYILYKPEDPDSYLLTETDNFNVYREEINFKGLYAIELRGLWKLNGYYMGGPFISYAMVDESNGRLYYIEAFLYSPGKPQRDIMRELETILKTFKIAGKPA
jgi:hypothetical protein